MFQKKLNFQEKRETQLLYRKLDVTNSSDVNTFNCQAKFSQTLFYSYENLLIVQANLISTSFQLKPGNMQTLEYTMFLLVELTY